MQSRAFHPTFVPALAALCAASLMVLSAPVHAGDIDTESRIFTRWDFPDGLPFLGADSKMESRMVQRWNEAQARAGFEPVGEPQVTPKGDRQSLMLSPNHPVPASAMPKGMENQVWQEFWVRTVSSPADGGAMRSYGSRYIIRCKPLAVINLGTVYFDNPDSTGAPSKVYAFYRHPMDMTSIQTKWSGHQFAVERTCSKEIAEATEERASENMRDLMERLEDMQKIMAVRLRKTMPPGGATSASASASAPAGEPTADPVPAGLLALMQDPTLFDEQGEPRPARIRLFGANGGGAYLHKGVACYSDDTEIQVAGGLASSFKSLIGATSNLSIGMPATELSRGVEAGGWNMGAKWFYQEHQIPPGEPTTVRIGTPACQMTSGTFIAIPGVDYEAKNVRAAEKGRCLMTVNRILPNGELKPVPIVAASRCVPGDAAAKSALDLPRLPASAASDGSASSSVPR